MEKITFINGNGESMSFGYGCEIGITDINGLTESGLDIQGQTVPMYDGQVFIDALIQPRNITAVLSLCDNNNLITRENRRRSVSKLLNPKFGEGTLIYECDLGSRKIGAIPQLPIFKHINSNSTETSKMTISFTCPSPYWEDMEESVVELKNGDIISINNDGDSDLPIKIEFSGTKCNNPQIKNISSEKYIKYNDTCGDFYGNKILINTEQGKKNAYKKSVNDMYISSAFFTFLKIAYGNGVYVGITAQGVIFISDDLINWNNINASVSDLRDIIYVKETGVFIAVGLNKTIIHSIDGVNWTHANIDSSSDFYTVTYNNGLYYANGTRLCTSSDLISWYKYSASTLFIVDSISINNKYCSCKNEYITVNGVNHYYPGVYFTHMAYCNGVLAVLAGIDTSNLIIYTKKDSETTFTKNAIRLPSNIVYITTLFSDDTHFYVGGYKGQIGLSTDGVNWTWNTTINNDDFVIQNGMKVNDKYVMYGNLSSIYTSDDLSTWHNFSLRKNNFIESLSNIICPNTIFIVCDRYNIYTSKDAITWSKVYSQNQSLYNIYYMNTKYIVIGQYKLLISSNTNSWTSISIPYTFTSIAYGNGIYVGINNNGIYKSYDLINWIAIKEDNKNYKCIIYGNNKFIIGSNSGIDISLDGITWTHYNKYIRSDIYYFNNLFISYGTNGYILTSPDGIEWTRRDNNNYNSITFNYCIFIVDKYYLVGTDGYILTSPDGIEWTQENTDIYNELRSIAYYKDVYVIIGDSESIFIKNDKLENVIKNVSGDMNMRFEVGDNIIQFECPSLSATAKITYTKRYLGV